MQKGIVLPQVLSSAWLVIRVSECDSGSRNLPRPTRLWPTEPSWQQTGRRGLTLKIVLPRNVPAVPLYIYMRWAVSTLSPPEGNRLSGSIRPEELVVLHKFFTRLAKRMSSRNSGANSNNAWHLFYDASRMSRTIYMHLVPTLDRVVMSLTLRDSRRRFVCDIFGGWKQTRPHVAQPHPY